MSKYRVMVHYFFKKGMEDKAITMVEQGIFDLLFSNACTAIESFQEENNNSHYFYIAHWNSLDDAEKVQNKWEEKEKTITQFCTNTPKREFFIVKTSRTEKERTRE